MDTLNTTLTRITNAFWKELGAIEKLTKIRREVIALTLYRLNEEQGKKWEAKLWKHTRSKDTMRRWVQDLRKEANYDEHAFLELARLLPAWARRRLLEITK